MANFNAVLYFVLALQLLLAIGTAEDAIVLFIVYAAQLAVDLYSVSGTNFACYHPLHTEASVFCKNAVSAARINALIFFLAALTLAVNICMILGSILALWLVTKLECDIARPSPEAKILVGHGLTRTALTVDVETPLSSPASSYPSTPVVEAPPKFISYVQGELCDTPAPFDQPAQTAKEEMRSLSTISSSPEPEEEADVWYPDLNIPWIEHKIPLGGKPHASGLAMPDLELTVPLGSGAFSAVFKATAGTGKLYATKVILKEYIHPHPKVQFAIFKQEVLALAKVNGHPSFMNIYGAFESDEYYALVLKCYNNGTLEDLMAAHHGRLSYNRSRWMTAEILEGLDFLHKSGIIYRDLKPSNILIDDAGHAIFTDFGLSFVFPPTYGDESPGWRRARRRGGADFPPLFPTNAEGIKRGKLVNAHVINDVVGSRAYVAPEILNGEAYSYGVDYFAMGVLLYEMVTGELPYVEERQERDDKYDDDDDDEDSALAPFTLDLELPLSSGHESPSGVLLNFLEQILIGSNGNPSSRLNVAGMKEHPYFLDIDWDQVLTRPMRVPF